MPTSGIWISWEFDCSWRLAYKDTQLWEKKKLNKYVYLNELDRFAWYVNFEYKKKGNIRQVNLMKLGPASSIYL